MLMLAMRVNVTFAQAYVVTPIVHPAAPYGAFPTGLSQDGWVVGQLQYCCGKVTSWSWKPDAPNGTTGTVTDFGTFGMQALYFTGIQNRYVSWWYLYYGDPGSHGHVLRLNANGTAGESDVPLVSCAAPYWDVSYGSVAKAVNSSGAAVGGTCVNATFWNASGTPPQLFGVYGQSAGDGYALNEHGVMTGTSNFGLTDNSKPPCSTGYTSNCSNAYGMAFVGGQYIQMVPGTASCGGNSINENNEVAGGCITHPENGGGPRAWAYIGGQMIQIGCDASGNNCANATAHGINNHSVVVGSSDGGGFIWDAAHGMRLLNSLIPSPEISQAYAINDIGQILAECGDFSHGTAQPCVLTPVPSADLSIAKSASASAVAVGDTLSYTITVTNAGPNDDTAVVVTDPLPANATFVSATTSAGSCSGAATISCAIGNLAANATATIVVTTTAAHAGTLSNTATVAGDVADATMSNNTATATTTVNPRTPVITWNAPSNVTYGTALSASQLNASADTAGAFVYSPPAGTVLHAGARTLSVAFTPSSADYSVASAQVAITVDAATVTVTAANASKVFGAPMPPLTVSYTGFVNGDGVGSLASPAVASTGATATSPVGAYPVMASGASAADYVFAYSAGTLNITPASTTAAISASPNPSPINQPVTLTAIVSAIAPGAGVPTGSISFMDGATTIGSGVIDGSGQASFTTSALGAGSHSISASYAGDGNFFGSNTPAVSELVTVPTPTNASIADLLAKVAALNLNSGQKNSLSVKLLNAQASLARGNTNAASNQLGAFINELQAYGQSGKLTDATVSALVVEAQAVIAGL
jgi:uncharacterized repeat protein (TIGR01451 family)